MGIQINDFLNSFSGDSRLCLSLPVFWGVTIDGVGNDSINTVLSDAGEGWRANMTPNSITKNSNIMVAQEVTLPNESSVFNAANSGSGMGGYLPGYMLDSRADFLTRSVTVNFLETNQDLEHNFMRPWMIAVGINGLVGSSLKATMEVRQYANDGSFRKGFRFNRVFPTAVEGFTLNYNNTDFTIKSVTFACQNYVQL